MEILAEYLPKQLSVEEVEAIVKNSNRRNRCNKHEGYGNCNEICKGKRLVHQQMEKLLVMQLKSY